MGVAAVISNGGTKVNRQSIPRWVEENFPRRSEIAGNLRASTVVFSGYLVKASLLTAAPELKNSSFA
jgi:hypothetical protein